MRNVPPNLITLSPRQLVKLAMNLPAGGLSDAIVADLREHVERDQQKVAADLAAAQWKRVVK